ncbi:extracellular solute-binding protein, family 5 [Rubrobacter xylanophilus DSM 9941]|uniref:Extracellular solute-binding protein, family 5 n=1 Tax=Rubrobacter xylanophilus (strain DSM 9941 / JCM 11954 / NBRC 16129 / PRD-1) TaxID=266117 RepID=Q1AXN9_RUBXD|nr:peptide ABC transporter substrate-binding protein [Rubrobacter xylanophilus]ABG03839.1 extracellular solute-binding protein, family 5 [Rubrobacter xylanophilus DSM 9941]
MGRRNARARVGLAGISRGEFLKLSGAGLAGAALLGAAGCGGEQGGGQRGGGGGGRTELIVGLDQEPAILNGYIVGGDLVATSNVTRPVMESVLQIMPDLSYAPKLADGEPRVASEDPLTIEFRLKDGITWSDGEPLTVEDYVFTYNTVMNDRWQIITREIWDSIDRIETPDELTARIIFKRPDARWRDILAADVLPKHVLQGKNFNKYFNDRIVGSGPYVFEEWRKGQSLTVVANENYWGDPPAIKKITFRFIPDTNSLKAALRSGEVQFINPPPDIGLIEELRGYDGVTVQTKFGTVWEHLAFNVEKVDNLNIRRAIAYAVNRRQLIQEILQGEARPLQSVLVPEQEPFYTPAWERYSFDPDRARRLVEQARGEGASTEIEYSTTSGNALRETAQQVIQQQMEQVGITLRINNSSAETYFGERTPEGDFEMGEWAWSATPDPSITTLFGANQVPPNGQNYYRYRNEEVTRLLEQADITVDQQERARLTRRAQELMAEDVPLVPLYQRPEIYAYADNLEGPRVNPTLATAFWNVGEWRFTG